MADSDAVTLATITYYCREKYYHHMQNAALDGLRKYGNDPILKFFNAYSMVLIGGDNLQEGMRELELLKDKIDVNLCSLMALIIAHKKCKTVDSESVQQLETKLKDQRKQAGDKGLYFAGLFLFLCGRYDKAREYVDRMLKINTTKEGLIIKGWIDLFCGRDAYAKKSVKYFDDAMNQDGVKEIDALLGKARFFMMRHNFSGALEFVNQVIVAFPTFIPGFIEKMRLQLAVQDWEQTIDVTHRALSLDSHCLEAIRFQILNLICRDGNYQEAASRLGDLLQLMDRVEPKNADKFYELSRGFCRIASRNTGILQQTYFMAERAVGLDSTNAEYVNELGYELLLQGRVKDAMKCYKNAMKLDETSVAALTGIIHCQLLEDQLEDAAQQLEFLNEIQQSIGKTSELMYLSAVLARKRNQDPQIVLQNLDEAIETHFIGIKDLPLGPDYYMYLNPDFLLQVINEYLMYAPQQVESQQNQGNPVLKRCTQILEPLNRAVPGMLEGLYLMAKIKYISGNMDASQSILEHCLDVDPSMAMVHLLLAQILLEKGKYQQADQSLEMGLSHRFEVREHPLYHLIKARIQKKMNENEEAVKTLQSAMSLPGVRKRAMRPVQRKPGRQQLDISTNDRVSVFLELADAHRLCNEQHEAVKIMQDAISEFEGTPEEIRITIANADISIAHGDVDSAINTLRNVQPGQPYFVQAREKMAEIYLQHRNDKRLYAGCYRELVEKNPTPHSYLLLGDAYMGIQEPEKAIEAYEAALKKNPRDSSLASKMGQALFKTHNYGKAINYYEAALKSGNQSHLRYDLADLLLKLRQYEKAEKVLKQAIEQDDLGSDLQGLMQKTRYYVLLSKVYQKVGRVDEALTNLNKAREMQSRVLKRVQTEQPDAVSSQKQLAADICCQVSEHAASHREYDKAIKSYKEALTYMENDSKIMLELARLYLLTEDLDSCQHQCMTLLKADTENDAATVMMADLMFRKNEYDSATFHFQQLLERKPDHYEALARLIDLLRRAGKLEDAPRFLETAEKASNKAQIEPGFQYSKGIYEWHLGNPNAALRHFNKARKDTDWGQKAVFNMIEICLNPDNETIGGEVFESVDNDSGSAAEKADSEQLAVRTADKLLKELRIKPSDIRPRLLENMILVATKNKANVEKALSAFMEIASTERDHVGALYGMATAYMVLKQVPRARNQLKRIAKVNWNMQDAEDLEKGWLLLADIYIQSGKYDMAQDLLKRCLQHNLSCCKAYEYMGFVMEKEQSYKDAAKNYEMAWKYGNKNNPAIGYKLGFNYLKARRFTDAIDICHHVLASHANYPKIRKDILDKARASLRV
ncbi:tetratricopeptide repeat protein 21B-like [Tubulanus polymorphus]|uniref:tetratricopeptide repeat protein 21B-like n=1 Tax=Tubulanus polymorphus TaxID=672921 RepID=UPI003DA36E37